MATGQVISSAHRRHRSIEFRKFLNKIDKQLPAQLDIHRGCDSYATRKTDIIQRWLAVHPRFHVHFVSAYSSWPSIIECRFAELTTELLQRGVHAELARTAA